MLSAKESHDKAEYYKRRKEDSDYDFWEMHKKEYQFQIATAPILGKFNCEIVSTRPLDKIHKKELTKLGYKIEQIKKNNTYWIKISW